MEHGLHVHVCVHIYACVHVYVCVYESVCVCACVWTGGSLKGKKKKNKKIDKRRKTRLYLQTKGNIEL